MRHDLPSGTITFLFTDVEGSTRLLHELGAEAYAEALAEHRRVIREACSAEGGVEVDTQGDAFFFAFPTAPGALAAAAAFTEGLASGPVQVRVGLHTGTPLLTEEGYVGDDVHRAARIAACGHGRQVLVSASTASLLGEELTDLGEHRLKDLSAPERVHQLGDTAFPPLKTLYQTNLPVPQTPFLGREKELAEVMALVARDDVRVVTLTGPGGTGKTRLAVQAAGALAEAYPHGVYWVPLASIRDPELVLQSAAAAVGSSDGLASHIGDKSLLLLFDNFEQVADAASGVAAVLGECPNVDVLVTSRELLHLSAEHEYSVPPFAHEEGVGFFVARARAIDPEFVVDDTVQEICRRLDELPLALELAAARLKVLSTAQILERLEQRLPLLTGGARDIPERQRTLRATIEWSYELLTDEEKRLFARLAVFTGGCTLDAAEEVCEADLDTLQSLVEKSLLRFTDERYWMLETIREYALDRLATDGYLPDLAALHARWVAALAELSEPDWYGSESSRWVARLESELANVRAAVAWGLSHDRELALMIVADTWYFWGQTERSLEARRTLAAAWMDDGPPAKRLRALRALSAAAMSQNDNATVISASRERLELARELGDERHESAAMGMLAAALSETGDVVGARRWFEEAIAFDRARGVASASLGNLGRMERSEGNLARSRELLEEDLRENRAIGNEIDIAYALKELAATATEQGAMSEARDFTLEGLDITRRVGLPHLTTDLLFGVAILASRTGRSRESAVLFGFADAAGEREGFEVLPTTTWWWKLHDRLEADLGTEQLERLRRDGRSLDAEQAIARARSLLDVAFDDPAAP